mmetsp:Transcript_6634/g.21418  ORF Transcript_6634/g.21418 Transcript_6634/m.21418 type:complete len:174 (-) Transcript_6634:1632-2153(-)
MTQWAMLSLTRSLASAASISRDRILASEFAHHSRGCARSAWPHEQGPSPASWRTGSALLSAIVAVPTVSGVSGSAAALSSACPAEATPVARAALDSPCRLRAGTFRGEDCVSRSARQDELVAERASSKSSSWWRSENVAGAGFFSPRVGGARRDGNVRDTFTRRAADEGVGRK